MRIAASAAAAAGKSSGRGRSDDRAAGSTVGRQSVREEERGPKSLTVVSERVDGLSESLRP